ncbi:hypothetical protein RUND412_003923 [Rhizina undulata]
MEKYMQVISSGQPTEEPNFDHDETLGYLSKQEVEACFCLVDYVTAVLVRLITEAGYGDYWHNNLVGVLAKWTAKTKVLLLNLRTNSTISHRVAEAIVEGAGDTQQSKPEDEEEDCEALFSLQAQAKGAASTEDAVIGQYCLHQTKFRTGFEHFVRYVLASLQHLNCSGLPMTSYEAMLFQDRDHEFSATSDLNNLNVAHSACSILNQTLKNLSGDRTPSRAGPPVSDLCEVLETTIEWSYSEEKESQNPGTSTPNSGRSGHDQCDNSSKQTLILFNMEDIVTVMVPLAATSPITVANINSFRDMVGLTGNIDDVQAVDDGLFSRNALIAHTGHKLNPTMDRTNGRLGPTDIAQNTQRWQQLTSEMDEWIYEESSVIVYCGLYVWSVIAGAVVLVVGGLAIGLTVSNRIKGVDPLSVTGINEQLILAKLLHDEQLTTILNTRSPYNQVFQRKSEGSSGFSIDRPLCTHTMLLSGLTPLKVVTPQGHALVCLDARRGTYLRVVEHRGLDGMEHLVCDDINRPRTQTAKQPQALRLQLQKSKELRWKKVQGVYNNLDAVFV